MKSSSHHLWLHSSIRAGLSSVQSKLLGLQQNKALTTICQECAIADHVSSTNHRIKWDHFEILGTGRSDMHCKIKESLFIRDLKPALNENVGSEKLLLYFCRFMSINFVSSQSV